MLFILGALLVIVGLWGLDNRTDCRGDVESRLTDWADTDIDGDEV